MGKENWELTLLRRVAQRCKEATSQEHPGVVMGERVECDEGLARDYIVLTLEKNGDLKGYKFIETATTFLTPTKAKRYTDILMSGRYLGIVVPRHSRDRAVMFRSQFGDRNLANPAFFVYDEYGDVTSL